MTNSLSETADVIISEVLGQPWDYTDSNTQYLTHNIHRYSGKFIPQIAARAISLLTQPGDLVVDPYCGSGTTLLESALLGRRAVGVDLNPLAVLITRVKTTPIPEQTLNELIYTLVDETKGNTPNGNLPLFGNWSVERIIEPEQDPRFHSGWYRKWFQPDVLKELIRIDLAIKRVNEQGVRDVARIAFSDILRRSSNAHSGYPNVMFDRNSPRKGSPTPLFLNTLKRNAEMISSLSAASESWPGVQVALGDASALPVASDSVDAVISHPPYIGSVPYAEYGSLSLQWLGVDSKKLDRQLTGGHRQSRDVVSRFEDGYRRMLQETRRILRPGRLAFLMVGNPVVRGETVNLAEMTLQFAFDAGLQLAARTERQGVNRRGNNMGTENLLFFRKSLEQ